MVERVTNMISAKCCQPPKQAILPVVNFFSALSFAAGSVREHGIRPSSQTLTALAPRFNVNCGWLFAIYPATYLTA
jgi:hypothetical protein